MSISVTQVIADNIKKQRNEKKWSQDDLAAKLQIARPTISKWENALSEPSSSQLAEIAKIFGVSTDLMIGNSAKKPEKIMIVDTSVLMKKPVLINELDDIVDEIIIPDIVYKELNFQKDKNTRGSQKQKAWLAMANIQNQLEKPLTKVKMIETQYKHDLNNDEKIATVAKERANQSLLDKIYVYTDDIYFSSLFENYANVKVVTPKTFEDVFPTNNKADPLLMQELFSAVKLNNADAVKRIDETRVDINKLDSETGFTPLILAIRNKNIKMINCLMEKFPNLNLETKDKNRYIFTPLLNACQMQNLEVIKILVEAGADVNMAGSGTNHGNTPLMVCAWEGFIDGVKYLMEQDVSYNQQDNNGYTALHKACIKNKYAIIKLLIPVTDLKIRDHKHRLAIECIDPNNSNSKSLYDLFIKLGKNNE